MKYLNNFNKHKLLTFDINIIYNQIKLYKVANGIYCVTIKDDTLRGHIFLRYQEYYESPSEKFRNKNFTWEEYIKWYKSEESPLKKKSKYFTYGEDWAGYNLPSYSIENALKDIKDPNEFDKIFKAIYKAIRTDEKGKFYLIGVDELIENNNLLDHELAHGFYYTNSNYKNEMDILIDNLPIKIKDHMSKALINQGYSDTVIYDEIQAYMSTGLIDKMKKSKEYTKDFEMVFNKHKESNDTIDKEITIVF